MSSRESAEDSYVMAAVKRMATFPGSMLAAENGNEWLPAHDWRPYFENKAKRIGEAVTLVDAEVRQLRADRARELWLSGWIETPHSQALSEEIGAMLALLVEVAP